MLFVCFAFGWRGRKRRKEIVHGLSLSFLEQNQNQNETSGIRIRIRMFSSHLLVDWSLNPFIKKNNKINIIIYMYRVLDLLIYELVVYFASH